MLKAWSSNCKISSVVRSMPEDTLVWGPIKSIAQLQNKYPLEIIPLY